MLKGKTLIELTDVKTGKVERYEDENIITNAAQLYANAMASLNTISDLNALNKKNFPLYKGVFGGIKLFENAITESAENWHMPKMSESKIIGYASTDTSDGTDTMRGSANLSETVVLENGMQLVWDFATSEANGTISCVCLTSGYGGERGFNLKNTPIKLTSLDKYPIGFDKENGYIYCTKSQAGNTYINKYKTSLVDLGLDDMFCIPVLISTSESAISFANCSDYKCLRMLDANTAYYVYNASSNIKIYYYDIETGAIKDTKTIDASNLKPYITNASYPCGLVKDGYAYIAKSTKDSIYKIDLSNTSNVVLYEMEGASLEYAIYELPNGDLMCGDTVFSPETGDYQCGICKIFDTYCKYILEKDGYIIFISNQSSYEFGADTNKLMLHSINNLDTPVTKTADKTMKITYTLTYTN